MTTGKETIAKGPKSKGASGWVLLFAATASWAALERPCVNGAAPGGMSSGSKYSATRRADSKIRVWMMLTLMLSARSGEEAGREASTARRASVSTRRTDIHSTDLRLLCWKKSIRGVERSSEVYCLWSWDFRNSGGRCDGG